MRIFLIGMPGAGKSTIGQQLSQQLNTTFVDLDKEIEDSEGALVKDIFAKAGEEHFRLVESRLLKEWSAAGTSFIMATGGGTPCFHDGIGVINASGISIFIDEPIAVLVARVKNKMDRPLLHARDVTELKERLEKLRAVRLQFYERASITIKRATLSKVMKAIKLNS